MGGLREISAIPVELPDEKRTHTLLDEMPEYTIGLHRFLILFQNILLPPKRRTDSQKHSYI